MPIRFAIFKTSAEAVAKKARAASNPIRPKVRAAKAETACQQIDLASDAFCRISRPRTSNASAPPVPKTVKPDMRMASMPSHRPE